MFFFGIYRVSPANMLYLDSQHTRTSFLRSGKRVLHAAREPRGFILRLRCSLARVVFLSSSSSDSLSIPRIVRLLGNVVSETKVATLPQTRSQLRATKLHDALTKVRIAEILRPKLESLTLRTSFDEAKWAVRASKTRFLRPPVRRPFNCSLRLLIFSRCDHSVTATNSDVKIS